MEQAAMVPWLGIDPCTLSKLEHGKRTHREIRGSTFALPGPKCVRGPQNFTVMIVLNWHISSLKCIN